MSMQMSNVFSRMLRFSLYSTSPHTHHTIFSSLDHVSILYSDSFHNGGCRSVLFRCDTRTTVPMTAIGLVVDFSHVFTRRGDDPARIKHHACNWVCVCIGIKYASRSKVPDLVKGQRKFGHDDREQLTLMLRSALPVTRCVSSNSKEVTGPV